jgi:tRNA A-37 threonylcarbamoyl transferase component Bud32
MLKLMTASADEAPVNIGPFHIVGTLGTGGMGTVYLGERAELFSQRVAIKVLHRGDGGEALLREAGLLLSLDHANIVRLLDTGVTAAGQRFLVMEYVGGLAIDAYCEGHRLSDKQRIELLLQVTDAMDYAHRHLVIHSDLKPANILVTAEGIVKVLDFAAQEHFYTKRFASPEQQMGERLTVASDVYTLGAVARMLLRSVERDLDAILQKAMRVDPEERYASMEAFSGDLQRLLDGRPITARPIGRRERTQKWALRHQLAAGLGAVLLATLILSTLGVVWQTVQASRQRRVTQTRLHDLVRLTGTLEGELYESVVHLNNSATARESLIQGATETLDALSVDDNDRVLALELARQYGRVAQLQAALSAPGAKGQARSDVAKGIALLRKIPTSDAQVELNELTLAQQKLAAD